MPRAIVVRLHPEEPTEGNDFTKKYLEGLIITAFDVSFDMPRPTKDIIHKLGQAEFDLDKPAACIVQHKYDQPFPAIDAYDAAATAVIEVPPYDPEYLQPDVFLHVERNGHRIAFYRVDYNAKVYDLNEEQINNPKGYYQAIENKDVSLFLALPPVGREVNPTDGYVDLPEDGSPPNFQDLLGAVIVVLQKDPGPESLTNSAACQKIRGLSPDQCRHIAKELAYNRRMEPLPILYGDLGDLYTKNKPDVYDADKRRQRFEAQLIEYYASMDAIVQRLYGYIVALSAALQCENMSHMAEQAGLSFPIRLTPAAPGQEARKEHVVLNN